MKVEHFLGSIEVTNIRELEEVLCFTTQEKVNEFWLSGTDSYPCLCISINNEFAHVHYFEDEGEPGFQALGHLDLNEDMVIFFTNNSSEKIKIEKEYVLKKDVAIKVACEFYKYQQLPKCVEWDEL